MYWRPGRECRYSGARRDTGGIRALQVSYGCRGVADHYGHQGCVRGLGGVRGVLGLAGSVGTQGQKGYKWHKGALGVPRGCMGLLGSVMGCRGVRGALGLASGLGGNSVQGPSTPTGSPGGVTYMAKAKQVTEMSSAGYHIHLELCFVTVCTFVSMPPHHIFLHAM